jgi:hypothetical protein
MNFEKNNKSVLVFDTNMLHCIDDKEIDKK